MNWWGGSLRTFEMTIEDDRQEKKDKSIVFQAESQKTSSNGGKWTRSWWFWRIIGPTVHKSQQLCEEIWEIETRSFRRNRKVSVEYYITNSTKKFPGNVGGTKTSVWIKGVQRRECESLWAYPVRMCKYSEEKAKVIQCNVESRRL